MFRNLMIGVAIATLSMPAMAKDNGDKIPSQMQGQWCFDHALRDSDVYVRKDRCEAAVDQIKLSQTDVIAHESECKNKNVKKTNISGIKVSYIRLSQKGIAFDIRE